MDQKSSVSFRYVPPPLTASTFKEDRARFAQSTADKIEVNQIMGKCDDLAKESKFGKTCPARDADLSCALEHYKHLRLTETTECLESVNDQSHAFLKFMYNQHLSKRWQQKCDDIEFACRRKNELQKPENIRNVLKAT